jgi:hypothetical protein
MSFSNLKKQSSLGSLTSKLVKEVEKMNNSSSGSDDRLWKPEVDKAGNGYAVIRFLPAPNNEELPWAKMYSHAFQGPGGWYIENSLTTLGQKDPLGEYNRELWNSGNESDKDTVRKQKRKLSYYSNIYVVQDKANPENEGRVFLYKYGKKIFDKIMEAMQPEFEDETPINPFDFWQGANFKLKIKKVAGYWNYDSSEFDRTSQLFEDDDAMEAVWEKQHSLEQIIAADQFKTYDQLEARLKLVLGQKKSVPSFDESYEDESEGRGSFTPDFASKVTNDPIAGKVDMGGSYEPVESKDSDEDDALSYFQKLAEE